MRCRHLVNGVVTVVVLAFVVGLSSPVTVQGQDTAPQPRNAEEFDEMFREVVELGSLGRRRPARRGKSDHS